MGYRLMPDGLFCLIGGIDVGEEQVNLSVLVPSTYLPSSLVSFLYVLAQAFGNLAEGMIYSGTRTCTEFLGQGINVLGYPFLLSA
jgi:hypothetical protein